MALFLIVKRADKIIQQQHFNGNRGCLGKGQSSQERIFVQHEPRIAHPAQWRLSPLLPPPQKELQALYKVATLGYIKRIRQHADHTE